MKVKRILAVAMATTMIMGSSMVAFASSGSSSSTTPAGTATIENNGKGVYTTSTEINTTFKAPIVKMVVPASPKVILNPYGIDTPIAEVPGVSTEIATGTEAAKAQIVSPVYTIKSESNVPVKVDATFTTTATGAVMVAKDTETKDLTTKWVKLNVAIAGTGLTFTDNKQAPAAAYSVDLAHKYTQKTDDYRPTAKFPAATFESDGTTVSAAAEATLTFSGTLANPAKVATSWTDTDKLKIVVKYDIYPLVQE